MKKTFCGIGGKELVLTMLYNAFAVLAVVFERWWISLFAVLMLQRFVVYNNSFGGKDDGEGQSEEDT